jgi:hypothetical protein
MMGQLRHAERIDGIVAWIMALRRALLYKPSKGLTFTYIG